MFKHVSNKSIIPIHVGSVPSRYEAVASNFKNAMSLYCSVVPTCFLNELRDSLKMQASKLDTADEQLEKEELPVETIKLCKKENYNLMEKVLDFECHYSMKITQETQRNDFCYKLVHEELSKLNFICKATIDLNDMSLWKVSSGFVFP